MFKSELRMTEELSKHVFKKSRLFCSISYISATIQTVSFFRCYFQFLNLKQGSRTTEIKKKKLLLFVVGRHNPNDLFEVYS